MTAQRHIEPKLPLHKPCPLKWFIVLALWFIQGVAIASDLDWTGKWDTRWEIGGVQLTLQQNDNHVVGDYSLYNGKLVGTVEGRKLTGKWTVEDKTEDFIAVMSADGLTFTAMSGGDWWTGIRSTDDGKFLSYEIDQSSPAHTLYYFLLIMNSVGHGKWELVSEASHLIDWSTERNLTTYKIDFTEQLFAVLDQLTFNAWDIKRSNDGSFYAATLKQSGSDQTFTLNFVKQDNKWLIDPPTIDTLQAALKRLQASKPLLSSSKIAGLESPRASLRSLMTQFDETKPDSLDKIINVLDLSGLPELSRRLDSNRLAGYLKRSLSRIVSPIWQTIPNNAQYPEPFVLFSHPIGSITLAPRKTEEGIIWQFTPDSLSNIRNIYAAVDELPQTYQSVGAQDTFSDYFYLRDLASNVHENLTKRLGPIELWQWLGLASALIVAFFMGRIVNLFIGVPFLKLFQKKLEDHPLYKNSLIWSFKLMLTGVILQWVAEPLGLPDFIQAFVLTASFSLIVISATVMVLIVINLVTTKVTRSQAIAGNNITIISLVVGILRVVIILTAILVLADLLGVPYQGIIAGLGVGGLAVALAAQPTLQNFISGITLYFDKPIAIGDFCRFGSYEGTVEFIGMRSTRIRTLDRTLVTIPNSEFSNMQIENYAMRDRMFLNTILQVRYETTPDQLRYLLAEINKLLLSHPKVATDPLRVRFSGFSEHSLNITIFAYVLTNDKSEFLAIQEDLYLRMMEIIENAGAQFSLPSIVYYEDKNMPPDQAKVESAESTVGKWRENNTLPFPDFKWQDKSEMNSTLDYPPSGSAVAQEFDADTIVNRTRSEYKSKGSNFSKPSGKGS
jgi:MscS family membrane protein